MLHAKSIRCYLLAIVVTMATVGCDDGTANHDVFTKADGTLNLCGTFDDNGAIVEKGDVVKIIRLINDERFEYTCAQFNDDQTQCLGIERKICKNDNFDDACQNETLSNDGLSKTETSKTAASSMPSTILHAVAKAEQIPMSSIATNTSKNTTSCLHRAVTAHALTSAVSQVTPSAMEKRVTAAKMTSLRSNTAANARIVATSDVINMATDAKTSASQIPPQTKNRAAQRANSNLYTT